MNDNQKLPTWDSAIDSLIFYPSQHNAFCAVHRRAFRTLLGYAPTTEQCTTYFTAQQNAFHAAAIAKIQRNQIAPTTSLHINSRDVKRQLLVVSV